MLQKKGTREAESSDVFFSLPVLDVFELLERGTDKRKEGRTRE
jgi:hypothetical protein